MPSRPLRQTLRPRQRVGKYRIEKMIAKGGFSVVYRARDTIEEIPVALKVVRVTEPKAAEWFRQEARLTARMDHDNILAIKDANLIDDQYVIVTRLGGETLEDRMQRRIGIRTALDYATQLLSGLAHAHSRRVMHLDVKPENLILFDDGTLRLTDFGIARFALRTVQGSGSGTVGYAAPEQAMGRPSFRSDVFSAGLVLWRLFSGKLPEWPFEWPLVGCERVRRDLHPDVMRFLQRSLSLSPGERFPNCVAMHAAFERLLPRALKTRASRTRRRPATSNGKHWREIRWKQFAKAHGASLGLKHQCPSCGGPVGMVMLHCPWCRHDLSPFRGEVKERRRCKRCRRGMKGDWRFCPWCFGAGQEPTSNRALTDKRYTSRCSNAACERRDLMPFMKYCPWCRTKVRRSWQIPDNRHSCLSCGWGVIRDDWAYCPWCARATSRRK